MVHRQGAHLIDAVATCRVAPLTDYVIQVWWSETGEQPGSMIEDVTIKAGKLYGFRSLDGQYMTPYRSTCWPVLPEGPRPEGLAVVFGCDKG
jgi:hypothetical protein